MTAQTFFLISEIAKSVMSLSVSKIKSRIYTVSNEGKRCYSKKYFIEPQRWRRRRLLLPLSRLEFMGSEIESHQDM